MDNELFSPEEMQSPFDAIKDTDAEGREWWNSRKLAHVDSMVDVDNIDDSYEAILFRIWAREVLKEYIIKGFVMDDERLKGKDPFGVDYFNDLLERVHEIRISERNNSQKIADIYAEFSCDYDSGSELTKKFYKTIRNLLHNEVCLNLLTTAFLDMAEDRAHRHILMKMADWKALLERYLQISDRDILPDAGSVTHEEAEAKALAEYEKFWRIQDQTFLSDFDKFVEEIK